MKIKILFVLFSVFLFTSCIELVEEIKINKDASGTISWRLETDDWLSQFMNNFSLDQINPIEGNEGEIHAFVQKLRKQDGITKVEYNLLPGDQYISIAFKNTKSLNKALYAAFDHKKTCFTPSYIKITQNKVIRKNLSPYVKRYIKKEKISLPAEDILSNISLSTFIHTPDKIIKVKGKNIEHQEPQLIKQSINISDFIHNKNTGRTKITF